MIRFTVPGEPQGKGRPRFANGHAYTPEKTREYEDTVKACFWAVSRGFSYGAGISLVVRIRAVYGLRKAEKTEIRRMKLCGLLAPTKKPDIDNILKIVCDALNGVAWHDDAQITEAHIEKVYGIEPRVEIWIEEAE